MAARSLIQLFREKNPRLLHHKYRVIIVLLLFIIDKQELKVHINDKKSQVCGNEGATEKQ